MGQTPDRINDGMEVTEARVIQLRKQIASKRQELGYELAELKRRRQEAMIRGKRLMKAAGIGAVGMVLLGSLTSALSDLVASDEDDSNRDYRYNGKEKSSGAALPGIVGFGLIGLRWLAKEYVEYKIRERRDHFKQTVHSHRSGNLSS